MIKQELQAGEIVAARLFYLQVIFAVLIPINERQPDECPRARMLL